MYVRCAQRVNTVITAWRKSRWPLADALGEATGDLNDELGRIIMWLTFFGRLVCHADA